MLGQLARQDQAHGRLDLAAGDGGLLGVAGQLGGLAGDLLKQVCGGSRKTFSWVELLIHLFNQGLHCKLTAFLVMQEGSAPVMKELRMDIARLLTPVSGWTCLSTLYR